MRRLLRIARRVAVATQHPIRRARVLRLLKERGRPRSVVFVCTGNICRSPYAASVARQLAPGEVRVHSAGLLGQDNPSPGTAVEVAARRGFDLRDHRSRLLTSEDVRRADLVIVMEPSQALRVKLAYPDHRAKVVLLGDLDPRPPPVREIPDPHEQTAPVFELAYSRIERCVTRLADVCWP